MIVLSMLFIIINRTDEKRVLKIINKYKTVFKVVTYGEGTASSSLLEYFDLNDEEKSVIMLVLPPLMCESLLNDLKNKMKVHELGKGISFTVPLSSSTKYMLDFYQEEEMEEVEMKEINNHLIITIVNQGYAEKVMTEAKKAGATGGTTINGRGLGDGKVIKFLNISIEPEKDIVLTLVPNDKKSDIMNAIVDGCGLKTPGAGICFSLPVDQVVGLSGEISD